MLKEGQPAPDFTLRNQAGEQITLSNLRSKNVVLYFYPKDNTPGCTKEACDFRDIAAEFAGLTTVVLGVSPDGSEAHEKFREKYHLPFDLLCDEEKSVLNAYGVWQEKKMYGRAYMGVERTTFVIDSEGIIRRIFPNVKVAEHAASVLGFVESLAAAD